MVKNIKKNMKIIFSDLLIMRCTFKKLKKSSLSILDDKRCYINETKSIPWN